MKKRRLAILGSTGSIGTQALEVAALHPDRFEVAVGELLQSAGEEPMRVGRIFDTVEETLARVGHLPAASLEQVMEADRLARDTARQVLHKLG